MALIVTIFFAWMAYYFITRFVLPVYVTTKHIREQFTQMKQPPQGQPSYNATHQEKTEPPTSAGEYIDYEEVK